MESFDKKVTLGFNGSLLMTLVTVILRHIYKEMNIYVFHKVDPDPTIKWQQISVEL